MNPTARSLLLCHYKSLQIFIQLHTCTCIYIYVYMYVYTYMCNAETGAIQLSDKQPQTSESAPESSDVHIYKYIHVYIQVFIHVLCI